MAATNERVDAALHARTEEEPARKRRWWDAPARAAAPPVRGRDYWRAGQQEDAMAGDEGIDDPQLEARANDETG